MKVLSIFICSHDCENAELHYKKTLLTSLSDVLQLHGSVKNESNILPNCIDILYE